ncbi:hypothetical protein GCM10010270_28660 [Streptomyces violaceus]|nr:hypothetical protein GCM10010270_28660 [Streptomyces janthinus]
MIAADTGEPLGNHPEHLAEPGAAFCALGRARGGPGTQCEHGGVIGGLGWIRGRQGTNAGGHRGVRRGGERVWAAAGHVGEALRFGQEGDEQGLLGVVHRRTSSRPAARSETAWRTSGWSTRPRRLPAIDHAWYSREAVCPGIRPEKIHTGWRATSVWNVN